MRRSKKTKLSLEARGRSFSEKFVGNSNGFGKFWRDLPLGWEQGFDSTRLAVLAWLDLIEIFWLNSFLDSTRLPTWLDCLKPIESKPWLRAVLKKLEKKNWWFLGRSHKLWTIKNKKRRQKELNGNEWTYLR